MTESLNTNGQEIHPTVNVLIADSDQNATRLLLEVLARKGIQSHVAQQDETAVQFLDKHDYDLVLIGSREHMAPQRQLQESLKLIQAVKVNSPELPVILMVHADPAELYSLHEMTDTIVHALRFGYCDVLVKPLRRSSIETLLDTLFPNHNIHACLARGVSGTAGVPASPQAGHSMQPHIGTVGELVGKSKALLQTVHLALKMAPTSVPILISGESGTGKELISHLIHRHSHRENGPYIRVNCAALSDSLLESELFGHEKGAFTGAYVQRKGRFEMAHGGTLLLDEITETPPQFQAKLLRVLEQQDFERVGGNDNISVNVRIISTTNKDLLKEVGEGRFRQDLYYRLCGAKLIVPPLRQRTEDLPELVWHFVNQYVRQSHRHITRLDPAMTDIFTQYHWPGNIRQLRNVVRTSLILGSGPTLSLADVSWLFDELQPKQQETTDSSQSSGSTISGLAGLPLDEVEKCAILDTLDQTSGNQTKAAKILGISDRTLRGKIRRYREEGILQPA